MRSHRVLLTFALALGGVIATTVPANPTSAAPTDIGYRNPSYAASGVSAPTGQKPQSKLWYHDGSWWGALFSLSSDAYTIWKLNSVDQTWSDTGVVIEPRNTARLDALFDGSRLYTLSAEITASAGTPTELRRFTYNPGAASYQLDPGFPRPVVSGGMEAAVLDKDSLGRLWVTYTRSNTVFVTHSTVDDATWRAPFAIPTAGATTLVPEDQSTLVAYAGRIGVMWSNENDHAMYFASHVDGAPDDQWLLNPAIRRTEWSDDHMNLKAAADGRVFAVTKTSLNAASDPLIVLSVLSISGTWTTYPVATVAQQHTRPIVVLDEDADVVYVFVSAPCCSGGSVYYKSAPMSAISFPPGLGTPIISSSLDPRINNVTSTKQNVGAHSGIVVLAGDDSTRQYLHNTIVLGSDTTPPDTLLSAVPSEPSGATVQFEFLSNESGATFECQLDGANWFGCASPHVITGLAEGPHSFSVRAADAAGNLDPTPASHVWNVVNASAFDLAPMADAYVVESQATANFGAATIVDVDANAGDGRRGLIKFDLSALPGAVVEARLRLYVTNGTGNGPLVYPVDPNWDELAVTWSSQPAVTGPAVVDLPAVPVDSWLEIDVTAAAAPAGVLSLGLVPQSSDGLAFVSREGTPAPVLHVVTGASLPETGIDSAPPPLSVSTEATFSFWGTGSSFECRLDAGPWASCTSPVGYTALADGPHQFEVQALNAVGADPTPAVTAWTTDTTPPTLIDTSPPDGATNVPVSTVVRATSTEPVQPATVNGSSFTLSPAGGAAVSGVVAWEAATNAMSLTPDAPLDVDTTYLATVSGVLDLAGNAIAPMTWTFVTEPVATDTTPPETSIDSAPTGTVGSSSATISFSANEAGSTFECQLDSGGFAPCASPATLSSLSDGSHNFDVAAIDPFGNRDMSPAVATWTVDATPPTVILTTPAAGAVGVAITTAVTATFSEDMDPVAISGESFLLFDPTGARVAGAVTYDLPTRTARLTPDSLLQNGAHYTAHVTAAARDLAGNPVVGHSWGFTATTTPQTAMFAPVADARVEIGRPSNNFGSSSTLTSVGGSGRRDSFVRFDVSGIGNRVESAVLRLYVTNGSANGPELALSSPAWTESTITWNNRPPALTGPIADAGTIAAGGYIQYDVTSAIVHGSGTYSFALSSVSTDSSSFSSRDASANRPELVIVSSVTAPDTDPPETTIVSGAPASTPWSTAAFVFATDETSSLLECSLDAGLWFSCPSTHTITVPVGSHTLQVRAVDRSGNTDPTPATWSWTVIPTTTVTFAASRDAYVDQARPTSNFGGSSSLYADGRMGARRESLLRFDVGGVAGTVVGARLRLFVRDGTVDGPQVYAASSGWVESAVTWNSRPSPVGTVLADAGAMTTGTWYEFDVTAAVAGDGTVSLVIVSTSIDNVRFDSREATNRPQLVIVSV